MTNLSKHSHQIIAIIKVTKAALLRIANGIKGFSDENIETSANTLIFLLKQHQGAYDEVDYILRDALCTLFLSQHRFKDAASILSGFNVESTTYPLADFDKADLYLKGAGATFASLFTDPA